MLAGQGPEDIQALDPQAKSIVHRASYIGTMSLLCNNTPVVCSSKTVLEYRDTRSIKPTFNATRVVIKWRSTVDGVTYTYTRYDNYVTCPNCLFMTKLIE